MVLDNVVSDEELFFLYKEIIGSNGWSLVGRSSGEELAHTFKEFNNLPMFRIKADTPDAILNYPLYLYFQSIIFMLKNSLREKNIGLPHLMKRAWINASYNGAKAHWLHYDNVDPNCKTILLFLTPVWETAWRGSFYVEGEKFSFKPGSAVIFDSKDWHCGEEPEASTQNWLRLTANIMVGK